MSNWAIHDGTQTFSTALDEANSRGILLPTITVAHEWTAWVELIDATPVAAHAFIANYFTSRATSRVSVIEFAIGGVGAEVPIAGPLGIDASAGVAPDGPSLYVPVYVPKGARIAARWRGDAVPGSGLANPTMTLTLLAASGRTPMALHDATLTAGLTLDASTTTGVTIDPGFPSNSEGADVELVSSLPRNVRGFFVNLSVPPEGSGGRHAGIAFVNIGAGGSEVRIAAVPYRPDVSRQMAPRCIGPFFTALPAGTRVTMSAMAATSLTPARLIAGWLTFF